MFLTAITVQGFADLPYWQASELERVVSLKGPSAATAAVGDALQLFFGVFEPSLLVDLLRRWAVIGATESVDLKGEPVLSQVAWQDRTAASSLVDPDSGRRLSVDVELELDPVAYRKLREAAAREPRLAAAVSDAGGRIGLGVGALFTQSFDVLALSLSPLRVGQDVFPLTAAERPDWATRLLRSLSGRFRRHDPFAPVDRRLLAAATAREGHQGYLAWQDCLAPHRLRAAQGHGRPLLLADERPLNRLGPPGLARARLGHTVHLAGADIVWAETADPWLASVVEGQGSALEQVVRVFSGGTQPVAPTPPPTDGGKSEARRTVPFDAGLSVQPSRDSS